MFEKLPHDMLMSVLLKLTSKERMRLARASKFFNQAANDELLWKNEFLTLGLPSPTENAKAVFKDLLGIHKTKGDSDYYVVGEQIHMLKKFSPYANELFRERNIPQSEIINSFPKSDTIPLVFKSKEAAKKYVSIHTMAYNNKIINTYAIFQVRLKDNERIDAMAPALIINATKQTESAFEPAKFNASDYLEGRILRENSLKAYRISKNQLAEILSVQLQDRDEIVLARGHSSSQKNNCLIM